MVRLLLVRHAESEWNREGRWQGWADPPLSVSGEAQAQAAGAALGDAAPERLVTSDLRRAARTAALVGEAVGRSVETDPDLREYDVGDWTGFRRDEIAARWSAQLSAWDAGTLDRSPGGEAPDAFLARLLRALGRLRPPDAPASVLAVSHGRAIAVLAAALGGGPRRIGHLEGWELALGAGRGLEGVELLRPVALLPVG